MVLRLGRRDTGAAVRQIDLRRQHRVWGWALAGFVALALVYHPMFTPQRWMLWPRCLMEGNNPELRDELALNDQADWQDLDQVAKFLVEQRAVADGTLTCYSFSTPGLYVMLDVAPSTRFPFFDSFVRAFPQRQSEFFGALRRSKQRFVITDLRTLGFTRSRTLITGVPHMPTLENVLPPETALEFPWSLPIVFRAGSYSVHAVTGPIVWPDEAEAEFSRTGAAAPARPPSPR